MTPLHQRLPTAQPLAWIIALAFCCTSLPCAAQRRADESRSHVILDPPGTAGPNNVLLQYQLLQQLQQMTRQSGPTPLQLDSLLDGLAPEDIADLAKWARENIKPDLTGSDLNNLPIPPKLLEQLDANRLAQQLGQRPPDTKTRQPDSRISGDSTPPPGQTNRLPSQSPNQPSSRSSTTSQPSNPSKLPSTSGLPTGPSQPPRNNRFAPSGQPLGNSGSARPQSNLPSTDQAQQPSRLPQQPLPSQSSNSNPLRGGVPANSTPSSLSGNTANSASGASGNTSSDNTSSDSATLRRRPRQLPGTPIPGTSTTRSQTPPSNSFSSGTESSPADKARKYFQELARDPDAAKQLIEKLTEKNQGPTSRSTDDTARSATSSTSNVPSSTTPPSNNRLPNLGSRGDTSVQDLIRNMSPADLPPLEEIAQLMPKSGGGNGGLSAPLAEKLKSMVDRDLSKQLDSNGITRTLRGLFNEARKAPPPQSSSTGSGAPTDKSLSSSVEKSVLSTLDGLGKSLLGKSDDKAKEQLASKSNSASGNSASSNAGSNRAGNLRSNSASNRSGSPTTASSLGNSVASASEKKEPGFLKSASTALDRWVTRGRNKPDASTRSSSSPINSGTGVSLPSELPGLGWLLWVALFAVAGLATALYLLRKKIPGIKSANMGFPLPASALENIRTHADVIQAFHALAFRSPGQAESWWTHRRAAVELSPPDTTLQSAWERLAKLYEEARYHQDRQELSPEKAMAARQALQTLSQAPSHA